MGEPGEDFLGWVAQLRKLKNDLQLTNIKKPLSKQILKFIRF